MSGRGRGYGGYGGRGSYNGRGNTYRGSYRGNSRGSFESRGGRGRGYSSYSSENRYNSGGGDRYGSGRERMEDSYKKAYRSEGSTNYSRDYGRSGSPERKRMRMDGGSGERRSHDGGSHYGGSYGNRQDSYVSERRAFGEDRRRSPSRDGYRKSGGMPPPRSPARVAAPRSRVSRPPRRTFRGRSLRTRGSFRGTLRSRGPRRFGDRSHSYTRVFRSVKGRSSIKSKGESASSTEEDWDADEKDADDEEKKEVKTKSPKGDKVADDDAVAEDGEETDKEGGHEGSEELEAPALRSRASGRPFIQLSCIHCKEKSVTFAGYAKHFMMTKHRSAMSVVARRHKAQLLRMRLAQRAAQRELESAQETELATRTTFCLVCRLNHRTTRHAHNLTDTHRAMRRFLMPYCRVCRLTFRSPMVYEHHICSLEHIKRKASQPARRPSPKAEGSGDEGMDVDLENFMTLDSVGDVDEVDDDESGGEKKEDAAPKKPKIEINIGSEHIKKLEVWWCELCRVYLPRPDAGGPEESEALRRHCRLRVHLGRYVQHRDTRTLRKHAERIHRQLHQQKDEKEGVSANVEKIKEEKAESTDEKNKTIENGTAAVNPGSDDKLWADVDKDLGELLREVDPQGSDDDEDLGRYDKFSKSDKKLKIAGEEDNDDNLPKNINPKSTSEVDTTT